MDDVARVDQCPSIIGNTKGQFRESLTGRDLKKPLERETYLSDAPLNYSRYLLLEMDEDLCAEDTARLGQWVCKADKADLPLRYDLTPIDDNNNVPEV